jgi:hypothetical protein
MKRQPVFLWAVIAISLALQLVCGAKGQQMPTPGNTYTWLSVGGSIMLLMACSLWAEDKGYSRNYGLLAFLSIVGVVVLALLPRKSD